jgi:hypothetical protein
MRFYLKSIFLTNSSVHGINTRNEHHLQRPTANLSCFQKGASCSGIQIFNNLPQSITSFRNEKPQFKVALQNFYMDITFTLWMNFLHLQMICITDLYDCVNSYTVIILCPERFCMFLVFLTSYCLVTAPGIYGCICIYIYSVSQEECARLRESVPYVKVYRYNPKHLYPKLNGYGNNGQKRVWSSCGSTYCTCSAFLNESFPNRWLGRGGGGVKQVLYFSTVM